MALNKTFAIYIAFLLSTLGCSKKSESTIKMLSHDSVIETLQRENDIELPEVNADCDKHLERILCISDKSDLRFDVNCSYEKVQPEQVSNLKKVKDLLPKFHQQVICNLSRIQIQQNIFSIAFASLIRNSDRQTLGTMMGVRPEVLSFDMQTPKIELYSWKEQLNFGISDPRDTSRTPSPNGPFVTEDVPENTPQFLTTIIHELNHITDILNDINLIDCRPTPQGGYVDCTVPETSYARFFWGEKVAFPIETPDEPNQKLQPKPIWHQQFPQVARFCYYYCSEIIPPQEMGSIYEELKTASFVTPYSTQNEREDFAEIATFYVMNSINISTGYRVFTKDKVYFDGAEHYRSAPMKEKREFVESIFLRDLKFRN